ncbi:MAG: 1-acyl-sn-glycerol-3-phosphate acyltransferase [Chloroflexi bacterium]|jgi:1-acyl-sn-glycerol-3-phosphate acyltransferase|nr:1-acyl-sn-glycerol-3-phosphate acyltransferase [Chloroflexota bacterium]MBT4003381.1 1-acyl-sn-glycerol-3-phosphate acyltransferase [Chloroflexota bacterium]MBT4305924.1 1-acyl-sn-glycerol-3-phosphate acyltransferase [Chloroflexota bacterium]MBT4533749.1 1-acyl-sn-glycerol-3-phosphate acyltransferase [Chloroflexota bacterium]MBT4681608.1 1-acyl-sn-glycerol-3-phosphate acyltransferase [Chloroflexota bacterium]
MIRFFLIQVVKLGFALFTRKRVIGAENIPYDKPVVLTANHVGNLDGLMILSIKEFIKHPNLIVVVAKKYQGYPIYRFGVKHMDFIFLDRFNPDIRAMKEVLGRIKNNGLFIIAPEGTRSPEGELIEGKSGAAYIAAKSNAWILPVSTVGTEDSNFKEKFPWKKIDITVTIGKPYQLGLYPKKNKEEFLKKSTDEIMCQIAAILPEANRGHYREYPRVNEIMASASD